MNFNVWNGVYETFQEAISQNTESTSTDIFTSRRWLDNVLAKTKKNINAASMEGAFTANTAMQNDHLAVLASQVANGKGGVRILDFGGGMGASVPKILASLPPGTEAEFIIVDNAKTCAGGRELFSEEPRVPFTESLPHPKQPFDIIHCESSLHYVDHWRQLLETLADHKADHLLFCESLTGEIPSFVSLQFYYEHFIPVQFLNIGEFINALEELDYKLIFQTEYLPTICGVSGPLPMGNFPEKYRLDQYRHFLFSLRLSGSGPD